MDNRDKRQIEELSKRSPLIRVLSKLSVIVPLALIATGVTLTIVFDNDIFVTIAFAILPVLAIVAVFWFLIKFSLGQIDIKEDKEQEPVLAKTRATIDMFKSARSFKHTKKTKALVFLIYGWFFICIMSIFVGTYIDEQRGTGTPVFMLIGMGLFVGTILLFILFGAIIPSIIRKRKINRIGVYGRMEEVPATVKSIKFLSATIGGGVTENLLITVDTQYGESKTTYKIKNDYYGDDPASRLKEGDQVTVSLNPRDPEYCKLPLRRKNI